MTKPTPSVAATPTADSDAAPPPHMSPERFRELGAQFLDWAGAYTNALRERPVLDASCAPGDLLRALPEHPPEAPGGDAEWGRIARDLDELIAPALLHWQHPGFFGYFSCNASEPAILGSLVASVLNVNGMLWATSPAATELETRVLDWCVELFDLPEAFRSTSTNTRPDGTTARGGGCIQGTASEATLVALLAARERRRASLRAQGMSRREIMMDPVAVVTSDQAHSSVAKAAMIAGVGLDSDDRDGIALVATDRNGQMRSDALRETLDALAAKGITPIMVCATMGTTGTTAVDDIDAVASVIDAFATDRHRPWLHVDAAFNGCALVCPELRWMSRGLEEADSLCINPHKWLLTNFDCDLFWTRDTASLVAALSITPEYLRNAATDAGAVIDYRDWQVPLGRSFRSLKLWFVLRHYGAQGLRAFIREHVAWATEFASWVDADERFELVAQRTSSLVCFRVRPPGVDDPAQIDAHNHAIMDVVNRGGRTFLSHTTDPAKHAVDGDHSGPGVVLRLAIGSRRTQREDVVLAWQAIRDAASIVLGDAGRGGPR
jgi:aromatic-L-amino-acid decarboxylase